MPDLRFAITQQ